jgi:hypothetical protein
MQTPYGHLTYCTNIHPGESWQDHFAAIREAFPHIKKQVSPDAPIGIGLRLSNVASLDLVDQQAITAFKAWLHENDAYVFTMNGFPYGGFHRTQVKDQVHAPDWTTDERVEYSKRLFHILSQLIPSNMDGGISTSPLSYRHWWKGDTEKADTTMVATMNIIEVVLELIAIHQRTGQWLHLDIEPEPDGLLETGEEFIRWFLDVLLPMGSAVVAAHVGVDADVAADMIKSHVQLCYDVCHFAIGYEDHHQILEKLHAYDIRVGKIQVSAALKGKLQNDKVKVLAAFQKFDEQTYLHQVVTRTGSALTRYRDLPDAMNDVLAADAEEWRAHFHVPVFLEDLSPLRSTQSDITDLLTLHKKQPFTTHLEVETYTWEVLPASMKVPMTDSIARELVWVQQQLSG